MAKPVGAACNLRCSYCYYLEKSVLAGSRRGPAMSPEVLERFIKSYIEAQTGPAVQFMWHGGEAMMPGLDFYRRVVELQNHYAGGRRIDNSIQTNGTLLTDEWCRFLKENGWLVGVSIDGPKDVHDRFRTDASGRGSFDRVMEGIHLMQAHGVEWNALAVVNSLNVGRPEEFYDFFKSVGCRYLQFTPVVERLTESGSLASATTMPASSRPSLLLPWRGANYCAGCSTAGCAPTWAGCSCSSSTPPWPTGSARCRGSAPWAAFAGMPAWWSSTATYTAATILCFRNIG